MRASVRLLARVYLGALFEVPGLVVWFVHSTNARSKCACLAVCSQDGTQRGAGGGDMHVAPLSRTANSPICLCYTIQYTIFILRGYALVLCVWLVCSVAARARVCCVCLCVKRWEPKFTTSYYTQCCICAHTYLMLCAGTRTQTQTSARARLRVCVRIYPYTISIGTGLTCNEMMMVAVCDDDDDRRRQRCAMMMTTQHGKNSHTLGACTRALANGRASIVMRVCLYMCVYSTGLQTHNMRTVCGVCVCVCIATWARARAFL